MIEDIPVTNNYCWWCRKLGHLAKYCHRLPEKIARKGYISEAFLNVQGTKAANCI